MTKLNLYLILWMVLGSSIVSAEVVPITTTKVIQRALTVTTTVRGTLESLTTPMIAAETAGRIIQLSVDEGNPVKSGQLLAKLDAELYQISLENAQADIPRLNALIANQQLTLKRYQSLVARQSLSQNELDQAKTDLEVLLAELAKVNVRIKEIQYHLNKTQISSPVTGVIQQRLVNTGDYVQTGSALFQVVSTEQLHARLFLPETLVHQVQQGQMVQLEATVQGQKMNAKVAQIRPMLNPTNRALEILVRFDNTLQWKAGTSVMATLTLKTHPNALMIPERCIIQRPAGKVVYTIVEGVAKQQVVEIGNRDHEWIEIVSGLSAGEIIALEGVSFLTDGASVKELTP